MADHTVWIYCIGSKNQKFVKVFLIFCIIFDHFKIRRLTLPFISEIKRVWLFLKRSSKFLYLYREKITVKENHVKAQDRLPLMGLRASGTRLRFLVKILNSNSRYRIMSHIGLDIWIFSEDISRWVRCLLDFLVDFHVILEFPFYIFEILNSGLADGLSHWAL